MARRTRRGADSRKGELRVALIGAAAVLAAAVITGLFSRGGGPTHSPYRAHLQVLDLQVTNGPPPARGGQTYDAARAAGVVVTLRNPGDGVSVITRARFVVEHFARLAATSDCIPGAGPIPVSANYRVQLAPLAHAGEAFSAPLSQEVRANGDDRVRIGFTQYESTAYPSPYVNGYGTGNASLYQLRVELPRRGAEAGARWHDPHRPAVPLVGAVPGRSRAGIQLQRDGAEPRHPQTDACAAGPTVGHTGCLRPRSSDVRLRRAGAQRPRLRPPDRAGSERCGDHGRRRVQRLTPTGL